MADVPLKTLHKKKETLFKSSSGQVYRIPALLYERESKTFLAFAEKRKSEDDSSTEYLVMKTGKLKEESSDERTIEWSKMTRVREAHICCYRPMNPCPVYDKNSKTLFLFFICVKCCISEPWQRSHGCNKTRLCYITSEDLGKSWGKVTDLTKELGEIKKWATFAVGPGHGVQTESGTLIVPTYGYVIENGSCCCCSCCCFSTCKKKETTPYALALYSKDSGKTWKFGKMLQNKSIECEMAEVFDDMGNSSIYCNARNEGGYRVEALSKDDGFSTLSSAKKLVETDHGCQGSVVSFPAQSDGNDAGQNKWLLYTHPTDEKKRKHLGVYLNKSPQDPNAWSKHWIINSGPSAYSDLAYIGNGWFACLMERGEQKETEEIASVVFSYNDAAGRWSVKKTACIPCMSLFS